MDEDLVNIAERLENPEKIEKIEKNQKLEVLDLDLKEKSLKSLENTAKKINAKVFAEVKNMGKNANQVETIALCLLEFFGVEVPRSFVWEPVCRLFSNPGPLIAKVRKATEVVRNKEMDDERVRRIFKAVESVKVEEVERMKNKKELEIWVEFFKMFCDGYREHWPDALIEPEPTKKKFKIPMSQKNKEEHELVKKINQEKRLIQELRYQERKLKWEEERQIKKEIKQEELRDQQREYFYTKNIEDEFREKQVKPKKIVKVIKKS